MLLVGGNAKYEVPFCLNTLAQKNQSLLGVHRGTREQLQELVDTFAEKKVSMLKLYKIPFSNCESPFLLNLFNSYILNDITDYTTMLQYIPSGGGQ